MKNEPPVLPPLLFLVFGIVGLLWLVEPALVGATPEHGQGAALPISPPYAVSGPISGLRAPASLGERLAIPAAASTAPSTQPTSEEELERMRAELAAEKEARRSALQAEREREETAWLYQRSSELAQELELGPAGAEEIARILIQERDRQSELWLALRTLESKAQARERLREEMTAIRRWREQELASTFGAEIAQRIEAAERATPER